MPRQKAESTFVQPDWWSPELYSYLKDGLPLRGWVWEFYRRAKLLKLGIEPVDAMNPEPKIKEIKNDWLEHYGTIKDDSVDTLYLTWPACKKMFSVRSDDQLLYITPAVRLPEGFTPRFHFQPLQLNMDVPKGKRGSNDEPNEDGKPGQGKKNAKWIKVMVDPYRSDAAIQRDFLDCLEMIRKEVPEPKRLNPKPNHWDLTLETWDLLQFGASADDMVDLLKIPMNAGLNPDPRSANDRARNAYRRAITYINRGKWERLAQSTDSW